ncbi:LexA family protein [Pseudomonas sp. NPDC088444]|uniref:LexA family protein n=1 Tax=Pseudomonas sp. NPDC088444 TaxID=3364456 RepID=UPI00384E9093
MQTKNELTLAQAETLAFIKAHIDQHGYSPTFAEIAKAAEVNVNAAGQRIAQMVKKGVITKADGIARSIRPVR